MVPAAEESGPDRAPVKSSAAACVPCDTSHRKKDLGSAWILSPLAILRSQAQVHTSPCPRSLGAWGLLILKGSVTRCGQESVVP